MPISYSSSENALTTRTALATEDSRVFVRLPATVARATTRSSFRYPEHESSTGRARSRRASRPQHDATGLEYDARQTMRAACAQGAGVASLPDRERHDRPRL